MAEAVISRLLGPPAPTSTHPEAALIERLVAGDDRAFKHLFDTYGGDVFRLARRFSKSDDDAQEVAQEVFIAAYRNIGRFRGGSRLKTWLYRITVNRALKRQRWWRRRREVGAEPLVTLAQSGVGPEARAGDRQNLEIVRGCLEQLDDKKRTVLVLHELEGLDTKQIAEVLGCPRSTVLTRLARARAEVIRSARRAGVRLGQ